MLAVQSELKELDRRVQRAEAGSFKSAQAITGLRGLVMVERFTCAMP